MRKPVSRAALVAALVAFAIFTASAYPALAQPTDATVEVRGCDAGDALVAAIRVELAAASTAIVKVTAVCLPDSRVLVVAFPPSNGKPAAREVAVADVPPDGRTRSIAIATGELFQSLDPRAPTPPPPATPPAGPLARAPIVVHVAAPPAVVAPREPPRPPAPHGWTIAGAMHARAFPTSDTMVVGPAAELDLPLGDSPVRLRLASDLAFADDTGAVGDASIAAWTGSVAFTLHASSGPLTFGAGPFGEGGGAFVSGSSRSPGTATEGSGSKPVALVGGQAILGVRFDPVVPYVALDAGGALAGVRATVDGDAVLAITGPFVGVRLGVAFAP
jgi:hypothetical protein